MQCHDEICAVSSARSTAALLHLGIAMIEAYQVSSQPGCSWTTMI